MLYVESRNDDTEHISKIFCLFFLETIKRKHNLLLTLTKVFLLPNHTLVSGLELWRQSHFTPAVPSEQLRNVSLSHINVSLDVIQAAIINAFAVANRLSIKVISRDKAANTT